MGVRGRIPTPSNVRIMEGMRGHRPLNPNEPTYTPGVPDQPTGMSAAARKIWDSLVGECTRAGVLRLVDAYALAHLSEDQAELDTLRYGLLARARAEAKRAAENNEPIPGGARGALAAIIMTTEGKRLQSGMRELSSQIIVQRREFGLTPSSATRVNAIGPGVVHIDELEADIA